MKLAKKYNVWCSNKTYAIILDVNDFTIVAKLLSPFTIREYEINDFYQKFKYIKSFKDEASAVNYIKSGGDYE